MPPPAIEFEDPKHPRFDPLYKNFSEEDHKYMPTAESLKCVQSRVTPYFKQVILPSIE